VYRGLAVQCWSQLKGLAQLILLLCYFTEDKLERLEGHKKRTLTSKDILRSLSEARDDHLRGAGAQIPLATQPRENSRVESGNQSSISNDPWLARDPAVVSSSSSSGDHHHQSLSYPLDFDDSMEGEERRKSRMCCICLCWEKKSRRKRLQSIGSNLTAEEEGEYLMECDELGLTWNDKT